mgnify:CR=1 FL=1
MINKPTPNQVVKPASVIIKGGNRPFVIPKACTAPTPRPQRQVKIHETEIGYPLFNIIATIQLAKPTTDPIDKSIPAVINTTV